MLLVSYEQHDMRAFIHQSRFIMMDFTRELVLFVHVRSLPTQNTGTVSLERPLTWLWAIAWTSLLESFTCRMIQVQVCPCLFQSGFHILFNLAEQLLSGVQQPSL